MNRHFWLDDEQWAIIEPLLPQVHRGPERVDDRRIISGILHRFREGCTWRAVPEVMVPARQCSTATTAGANAVCGKGSLLPWSAAAIHRR